MKSQKVMMTKESKSTDISNFIWNTLGTVFNAFNSLFFLIIVTRINGVNDAGIFSFGFSISTIFYIVAIYSGRTFQVTEKNDKLNDNDFIRARLLTIIFMIILSLGMIFLNQYGVYQSTVFFLLCIFRGLEAMSDVLFGIIQKSHRLDIVGKSLVFKSICSLLLFFVIDLIFKNIVLSIVSILILYVIVLLLFELRIAFLYKQREKAKSESIWIIFKSGFYTFAFTVLALYVVNAPRFAIESYLSESYQAIFSYVVMPSSIMILFGQFFCQPFLVRLAKYYNESEYKPFAKIVSNLNVAIVGIGLLALIAAFLLGIPVLELIYNVSLKSQKWNLVIVIGGAIFYTVSVILSNALISMRSTRSQMIIYIISSVFIFIISDFLVRDYGLNGGVWSYTITMTLQLVLYYIVYYRELKRFRKRGEL